VGGRWGGEGIVGGDFCFLLLDWFFLLCLLCFFFFICCNPQ